MMFFTYKEVDGEYLYMDNKITFKVLDVGKVILKVTFQIFLIINNVLYVTDFIMNLKCGSLLSKIIFKMVFESDKFILSKNIMFIEERYFSDDIFKINVIIVVAMNEKK